MARDFRHFETPLLSCLSLLLLSLLTSCNAQTLSPSTPSSLSSSSSTSSTSSNIPSEFGHPRGEGISSARYSSNGSSNTSTIDQSQVLQAQQSHATKVEIIFSARVKKLLPDDTKGLPHQRFLLEIENGTTVLVAHDTKYAPKVPIQPGDVVTIKGEYIWNRKGGVIRWTHRSDTPRHEGGYIEFDGQKYQ